MRDRPLRDDSPLVGWQVAADGCWENSLRGEAGHLPSTHVGLPELAAGSTDIAIELFFEIGADHPAFLGARLTHTQRNHLIDDRLLDHLLDAAPSGHRARDAFRTHLDPHLFNHPASWAELGVVNAWTSIGTIMLWHRGDPVPAAETIAERLRAQPHVASHGQLPIACEFSSLRPQPHWIGVPVSRRHRDGFRTDSVSVRQALIHFAPPAVTL